jgi:hypothetical protein
MIKKSVINQIRKSKNCKLRLQIALDRSAPTIQRYLTDNDIMLTTSKALEVIKSEFKLTDKEILS